MTSIKLLLLFCITAHAAPKDTFTFTGKVLITTGDSNKTTTEIFDLRDPTNKCENLPDYPLGVEFASGGLIQDKYPLVCGGAICSNFHPYNHTVDDCYYYDPDSKAWEFSTPMIQPRGGHASVVINKNTLWITGDDYLDKTISELITPTFPGANVELGPTVPESGIVEHCVVDLSNHNYLLIGKNSVWFYNMDSDTWTKGPNLAIARGLNSCGLLRTEDKSTFVVVVGGEYLLESVEIMEVSQENGMIDGAEWLEGPPLPFKLYGHASVVFDNSLFTFGGAMNYGEITNKVMQLSYKLGTCDAGRWEWSELGETQVKRLNLVAMEVPDEIVICEK